MSTILMMVLFVVLFWLFEKHLLTYGIYNVLRFRITHNPVTAKWIARAVAALLLLILLF